MPDDKKYWIGFNLVRGIGAVRFQQILSFFGDLSIAWQAQLRLSRKQVCLPAP